ncbi:MAG: aromatic ring-hydroxylating dioxygenase subunit alpha [Gammaproteobacteria bacterium]|nr:aromatic ring-hydroxylating dioxygenase subunit alpha [Gammaproteobacteria bacterium]
MLINLWYVAEWSKSVGNEPVRVKMLGQNFVLFRDTEGKAHCLSDVCLHRGGSLGGGWTKDNCVVCPYHGWRYSGDGKVAYVPSEGDDFKAPKRARIDSYPVEERYGMIWVFLGDLPEEERFPIPPCDEFGDAAWRMLSSEFTWKAEAARVVENGIDIAHASFVHPMFGKPESAQENHILEVDSGEWWGRSKNMQYPPKFKENWYRKRMRKEGQPTNTHPCWYLPGMVARIRIDINKSMAIVMFDANTPVDEHTTRTFALQFRSFLKFRIFDAGSLKRLNRILEEDATIVEAAAPNYLPDALANEMSVTDDKFMRTFRAARRKCIEERGWKIDVAEANKAKGVKVLNIPSPARRSEDMSWIIDTVPLVPARKSAVAGHKKSA